MPIYEYVCSGCGKTTEKLVSISSAETEIECPHCGEKAEKIISSSAFHLKGGGWYSQGYSNSQSSCASASKDSPKCASCPASKA